MPSVAVDSTRPIRGSTVAVVPVGPSDLRRVRHSSHCKEVHSGQGRGLCGLKFEDLDHPLGSSYDQRAYDYFGSWPDFGVGVAARSRPVQDLGGLPFLRHQRDLCGHQILQDLLPEGHVLMSAVARYRHLRHGLQGF